MLRMVIMVRISLRYDKFVNNDKKNLRSIAITVKKGFQESKISRKSFLENPIQHTISIGFFDMLPIVKKLKKSISR